MIASYKNIEDSTGTIPLVIETSRDTYGTELLSSSKKGVVLKSMRGVSKTTRNFYGQGSFGINTGVKRMLSKPVGRMYVNFIEESAKDALSVEDIILRIAEHIQKAETDSYVLLLFRIIDDWIRNYEMDRIELLMMREEVKYWTEDAVVALLSSTIPIKDALKNRNRFYDLSRSKLLSDYNGDEREVDFILEGLK